MNRQRTPRGARSLCRFASRRGRAERAQLTSVEATGLLSDWLCASFNDVEHPCQQCGTTVEDGRPFCPQCRAPQIHVQIAIPDAGIGAGLNVAPDDGSLEISAATGQASARIEWDRPVAVRAALQAGVLGVFIGIIPLLGIVLTGALAVFFYRRKNGFALPPALGSRLGGAAGVVAFAINGLFITVRIFVFHAQQQSADDFLKVAQRFGLNVADPDMQAIIHNLFTPSGLAIALFFGMIIAVVLASVGGALAALLLRPGSTRG
jgi:hypothetical protein